MFLISIEYRFVLVTYEPDILDSLQYRKHYCLKLIKGTRIWDKLFMRDLKLLILQLIKH